MKINREIFKAQRDVLSAVITAWGHTTDLQQKEEARLLEGLHDMLIEIDEDIDIGGEAIIEYDK